MPVVLQGAVQITLHQCARCKYVSSHKTNVRNHQKHIAACQEAGIDSEQIWVVRSSEEGVVSDGATTTNNNHSHNNTTHTASHNSTTVTINTLNIHFGPEVLPALGYEEADAIVEELLGKKEALRQMFTKDVADIVATMFTHTKGEEGPPHLQNVCMDGRHVVEKREDGESVLTPKQFAKVLVAEFLTLLENLVKQGSEDIPDDLVRKAESMRHKLIDERTKGSKGRTFTCLSAAELYKECNAEFHKFVPGRLKTLVLDIVQQVVRKALPQLNEKRRPNPAQKACV